MRDLEALLDQVSLMGMIGGSGVDPSPSASPLSSKHARRICPQTPEPFLYPPGPAAMGNPPLGTLQYLLLGRMPLAPVRGGGGIPIDGGTCRRRGHHALTLPPPPLH